MVDGKWYFERMTPEAMNEVIDCTARRSWKRIVEIYVEFNVSPDRLETCSSCSFETVILWTKHGIKTGQIYERNEEI